MELLRELWAFEQRDNVSETQFVINKCGNSRTCLPCPLGSSWVISKQQQTGRAQNVVDMQEA